MASELAATVAPATGPGRDAVIVADATGSMGGFLSSIASSLSQILSLMSMTGTFDRVRLMTYEDYCDGNNLLRSTEWATSLEQLDGFVKELRPGALAHADGCCVYWVCVHVYVRVRAA